MVIGENPERQLEPFDENLETPRYIEYTKDQLIEKGRKDIEEYKNGIYAEYLSDKKAYCKNCKNSKHLDYLENEFPEHLKWDDQQIYQNELKDYDPFQIGKDGEVYSEYNPNSKWDYYSLGGRWSGLIKLKEGRLGVSGEPGAFDNKTGIDQARKCDIANIDDIVTFALLKDGKWFERGKMGWWGIVIGENDEWDKEFKNFIKELPDDTLISIYDCHI